MQVLKSVIKLKLQAWCLQSKARLLSGARPSHKGTEEDPDPRAVNIRHLGKTKELIYKKKQKVLAMPGKRLKEKKRKAETSRASKEKVRRTGSAADDQETQLPEGHPLLTANNGIAPRFEVREEGAEEECKTDDECIEPIYTHEEIAEAEAAARHLNAPCWSPRRSDPSANPLADRESKMVLGQDPRKKTREAVKDDIPKEPAPAELAEPKDDPPKEPAPAQVAEPKDDPPREQATEPKDDPPKEPAPAELEADPPKELAPEPGDDPPNTQNEQEDAKRRQLYRDWDESDLKLEYTGSPDSDEDINKKKKKKRPEKKKTPEAKDTPASSLEPPGRDAPRASARQSNTFDAGRGKDAVEPKPTVAVVASDDEGKGARGTFKEHGS